MANKSNNNKLDFTKLTFNDIDATIIDKLSSDPRFSNFTDSQISRLVLDIFSSAFDFTNFYIERSAEETYLNTARKDSSIIELSSMLNYVPRRMTSAIGAMNIVLQGDDTGTTWTGVTADSVIRFNAQNIEYSYGSKKFFSGNTYSYTLTSTDLTQLNSGANVTISTAEISDGSGLNATISGSAYNIEILQGEFKTQTIPAGTGNLLQYTIEDSSLSETYAEEDFGYDNQTQQVTSVESNFTRISTDITFADTDQDYSLSKVNLFNLFLNDVADDKTKFVQCEMNVEKNLTIRFGDDVSTDIGPQAPASFYVKYFSTLGESGNELNVIGKPISFSDLGNGIVVVPALGGSQPTGNFVEFNFKTNVIGGSGFESNESVKINAPAFYQAQGRLITVGDYESYLNSITYPVEAKNSKAWGEQESLLSNNLYGSEALFADKQLFNIVLYSLCGSLYVLDNGLWRPKVIYSNSNPETDSIFLEGTNFTNDVIDGNSGTNYGAVTNHNLYTLRDTAAQLSYIDSFSSTSNFANIKKLNDVLESRGSLTIKPIYVSPKLYTYSSVGTVIVNKLSDVTVISNAINNALYEFYDDNADFKSNIYLSDVISIIKSVNGVFNVNDIKFEPKNEDSLITLNTTLPLQDDQTLDALIDSDKDNFVLLFNQTFNDVFLTDFGKFNASALVLGEDGNSSYYSRILQEVDPAFSLLDPAIYSHSDIKYQRKFFSQYRNQLFNNTFYNTIKGTSYGWFASSTEFQQFLVKFENSIVDLVKQNIIDEFGNLTNYTADLEITQIQNNFSIVYE